MPADLVNREGALQESEYRLLDTLYRVSMVLARHDRKDAIRLVGDEFQINEEAAIRWILKAEDFMTMGVAEGIDDARKIYRFRLEKMFNTCMAMAVRTETETLSKPTRVRITMKTNGVESDTGESKIVMATHTKVRPNCLDTNALNLARKLAIDIAAISGVRGAKGGQLNIGTLNIQNNNGLPGADTLQDLTNAQLVKLLGAEIVDVQQEPTTPAEPRGQEGAGETPPAR